MRRSPGRSEARGTAAAIGRTVLTVLFVATLSSGMAVAQDASGYVEWRATGNDSETTDPSGNSIDRENQAFEQRYNLDVAWRLYPNFTVRLGGLFERSDVTSESAGLRSDATARTFRPYLTATLRSAIYEAQMSYYLLENDVETGTVSTGNNQEIWNTVLGWYPELAPSLVFRWIRTDNYDDDRRLIDNRNDLTDLTAEYDSLEQVNFYYRAAQIDFEDHLARTEAERTVHAARINYGDSWWDRRLRLDAEYVFNDVTTKVTTSGTGEVESPLFPIGGIASLDDTPFDEPLLPNPLLIDDDRVTSAGINLVYDPTTEQPIERNIGLDFGGATTVNTLSVWIDNDLSSDPSVIDFFNSNWRIFTSSDNLSWFEPPAINISSTFGPFLNRFEIRFDNQTARYMKVVTIPIALSGAVVPPPGETNIPAINVTELTATRRTPAADAEGKSGRRTQLLTTNLRAQLTTTPKLYYEFASFFREFDSSQTLYTISNGLSLTHAFTPQYSVNGRVTREDSRESVGEYQSYIYSASFRAVPLETLQSNLVFSGRSTELEGSRVEDRSVSLYTTADLYTGISANLGLALSENISPNGERADERLVNFLATLVPHRTTTFNLLYQRRLSDRSGGDLAMPRRDDLQERQASVSYRPLRALYFFVSYRLEELIDGSDRYLRNYSASWNPFAGGALLIVFRFDESYNSQFEALSRISSPRIRWNITNRWWLEVAYQREKFDSVFQLREAETWTASTRITF